MKLDSLIAVFFGAWEGLGVDMSQGDVLVPFKVSHQDADLRLHQTDPDKKHQNIYSNGIDLLHKSKSWDKILGIL